MADSYTTNVRLRMPANNDRNWDTPVNDNTTRLDGFVAVGALGVTAKETPSSTLNVTVAAGRFQKSDGTEVSYAGTASQAMTASQTNYVYLTDAGTLTVNTSGFPATVHLPLAVVVTGGSTVTSITDRRPVYRTVGSDSQPYLPLAGGTMTDGANIAVGTTTGTKIGTSTSQKLGFFNATPIIQQANTSDLKDAFCGFGFMINGGASPLNLDSGALTCGAASVQALTVNADSTLADGVDFALGTSSGTKIGTATSQKLAFFNATPIIQQSSTADLKDTLCAFGFQVNGGASPLNLDGGALSCGALTITADSSLSDGVDFALGTSSGTKFGTATSQKLAFFNATPVVQPSAYTQTYSTADKTLSAYTSDPESSAYTGAADGEAKLADLNALRVAYENLRVFAEDLAAFVNSVVDDLQALGLVG